MSSDGVKKIRELFASQQVNPAGFGIQLTREDLLERQKMDEALDPTKLEFDEIIAAITETIRVELRPGADRITVGVGVKKHLAWTAHMVENAKSRFIHTGGQTKDLMRLCMGAMLVETPNRQMEDAAPYAYNLLSTCANANAYLAYPLLEASLRLRCAAFINADGKAIANAAEFRTGDRVSNVGKLLRLVTDSKLMPDVAEDVRGGLNEIGAAIKIAVSHDPDYGSDSWSQIVFDLRNDSLHAARAIRSVGEVMLSLALIVALDGSFPAGATYNQERDAQQMAVAQSMRLPGGDRNRGRTSFWPIP